MKSITYILTILIFISCNSNNSWTCDGNCSDGYGEKKWKDGGIDKGNWINGKLEGECYIFYGTTSEFAGDTYEGEYKNGLRHGYGTYIDVSEDAIYTEFYKNGKANGKGKVCFGLNSKFPNRYYDGNWKNGKRHGYGIRFLGETGNHTNDKYEGEWKNDEMHGAGRYDWNNGSFYIGYFENGRLHGKGTYTFPDGKEFKGIWKDGYCKELAIILHGKE
jgi:hypothetical protein